MFQFVPRDRYIDPQRRVNLIVAESAEMTPSFALSGSLILITRCYDYEQTIVSVIVLPFL